MFSNRKLFKGNVGNSVIPECVTIQQSFNNDIEITDSVKIWLKHKGFLYFMQKFNIKRNYFFWRSLLCSLLTYGLRVIGCHEKVEEFQSVVFSATYRLREGRNSDFLEQCWGPLQWLQVCVVVGLRELDPMVKFPTTNQHILIKYITSINCPKYIF